MSDNQLREKLHQYIDSADSQVLTLFSEIMQMDVKGKKPLVPEWYYKILEKELEEDSSEEWSVVKKKLIENYNL